MINNHGSCKTPARILMLGHGNPCLETHSSTSLTVPTLLANGAACPLTLVLLARFLQRGWPKESKPSKASDKIPSWTIPPVGRVHFHTIPTWNFKQPEINGCSNMAIEILNIRGGCFGKIWHTYLPKPTCFSPQVRPGGGSWSKPN